MDWSNEEYVRLYTRETTDDLELSWEALALWRAILCKFDRSGLIPVRNGWSSIARMVRMPVEVVERVGPELVTDGRVRVTKHGLVAPNFTEAQTASKSDKLRQRESRDRRRDAALSKPSAITRGSHKRSQAVTKRDTRSRDVTLPLLCSAEATLPSAEAPVIPPADAVTSPAPLGDIRKGVSDKSKTQQPKTRLPPGWVPSRSEANIAAEKAAEARGVDLALELAKLHDWAASKNEKKADWDAAWRNWTRNARPDYESRAKDKRYGYAHPATREEHQRDVKPF